MAVNGKKMLINWIKKLINILRQLTGIIEFNSLLLLYLKSFSETGVFRPGENGCSCGPLFCQSMLKQSKKCNIN